MLRPRSPALYADEGAVILEFGGSGAVDLVHLVAVQVGLDIAYNHDEIDFTWCGFAVRALTDETLAAMERDLAALYSEIGRPSTWRDQLRREVDGPAEAVLQCQRS